MDTSRRGFLKAGIAAAALPAALPAFASTTSRGTGATGWVTLGKSQVDVTRLAFGTGTHSGAVQRGLGQEEFTRLIRYAYDHGIRFFETADSYHGMPQMLAVALKGLPRDSYRLMTKYNTHDTADPAGTINRLVHTDLGADYVDILLLHCVRSPNWSDETKQLQEAFATAKEKKIILSHGASVHGKQALAGFPGNQFLDIAMIRMNHVGTAMDTASMQDTEAQGDVPFVVSHMQKVKAQGSGVISMKLVGEGRFHDPEERQKSVNFAFREAGVDAVTIGFGTTGEIDEAIKRVDTAVKV